MFLPVSVCLYVCLSTGLLKTLQTDFDENFWRSGTWPTRTNRLDFGGDMDYDPDAGIFKGYMYSKLY